MAKQFVGEKEIKKIDGLNVEFVDGSKETYTDAQIKYFITDEEKDATAFRDLVFDNVVPDALEVLKGDLSDKNAIVAGLFDVFTKHDVRKGDFGALLNEILSKYQEILGVVVDSFNEAFNIAVGKAFGTYKEGENSLFFPENIRVSDISRVKD